jgi:hypothetical protein
MTFEKELPHLSQKETTPEKALLGRTRVTMAKLPILKENSGVLQADFLNIKFETFFTIPNFKIKK